MADKLKTKDKFQSNFAGQHNWIMCKGGNSPLFSKWLLKVKSYAKTSKCSTNLRIKKGKFKPIYTHLAYVESIEIKTV